MNHTLAALPWWGSDSARIFRLARNMRASFDVAYADFCLQVGDGTLPAPPFEGVPKDLLPCVVELPAEVLAPSDWDAERLLHWVYEGFDQIPEAQWFQDYANRTVVTPTNETCQELNKLMLAHLDAATEICSFSHDTACTEVDSGETYSTEFLNSLETGGLPPHELRIRHGSLVILLRNFAPHKGLCNGTRLVVQKMHKYFLVVRIVTGPFAGNVEMLPRICCDSCGDCELPFVLRRHQYPVKPAWVMTINKSQGQSISGRLGIFLPAPVFAHGQLYVAFSRGSSFQNVRCVVVDSGDDRQTRVPGDSPTQPDRYH